MAEDENATNSQGISERPTGSASLVLIPSKARGSCLVFTNTLSNGRISTRCHARQMDNV
jgi:hypothetical protein